MSKISSGSFFLQWVTAVTVTLSLAMLAAFAAIWSVTEIVERALGETVTAFVVGGLFGAIIAGGVGIGQAVVLHRYGFNPVQWVVWTGIAGTVGMAIGMMLAFTFSDMNNVPEAMVGVLIGLSLGLPVGLIQWQMLKQYVVQAQLWLPICIVAFTISLSVGLPLGGEGREWLALGTTALLTAVLSGAGMLWLARGGETAVAA